MTPGQLNGAMPTGQSLLAIRDLDLFFDTRQGPVQALAGVTLDLAPGESLGIVGETGSGKSMTARAVMGLLPKSGRISGGSIRLKGQELTGLSARALRAIRGRQVAMVFQEAKRALNPVKTIGSQIMEAARARDGVTKAQAWERCLTQLARVGLPDPDRVMRSYSFELSGGMAQRVMIAIATVAGAELIIADEPTSALDVSIQAQILDLLNQLRSDLGTALVMITHDLGVAAENCDRIAVMYLGQIVEIAPADRLFQDPRHPYTCALIAALPSPEQRGRPIGEVRRVAPPPKGYAYADRRLGRGGVNPDKAQMIEVAEGHFVACQQPLPGAQAADGGRE